MKAIVIRKPGAADVLQFQEVATPYPGEGEVRIDVHACGVNRADLLQRMGKYSAPSGVAANIPGLEFSGVVAELGNGVTEVAIGDKVCGLVAGGAYAQQLVTRAKLISPIPKNLSFIEAASIPEAFLTAYDAISTLGDLKKEETLLIHAVGSGVGIAAIQIAKNLGAQTMGTSRSEAKLERALGMGLDHGLYLDDDQFAQRIMGITSGKGVDVILDLVGGSYLQQDIECLADKGRLIVVGLLRGARVEINWARVTSKRLHIIGTVLRTRSFEEKADLARAFETSLTPGFEKGVLKPIVDKVFPIEMAAQAHEYLSNNENFGKVVLEVVRD